MNLLTIKNLTKAYTDKILFDDIDFSVEEGEKVGIIGINGTGKSTLLRIIAGIEEGRHWRVHQGESCGNQLSATESGICPGTDDLGICHGTEPDAWRSFATKRH